MPRKKNVTDYECFDKPFPKRLRQLMEENSTTQQELATALGVTRQSISYYSDGSSSPDWEGIVKIAAFFSVSTDWLLGLSDVRMPQADVKATCTFTRLSEQAVINLTAYSKQSVSFIAKLIETAEITQIALLYENLNRSQKKLHFYEQKCSTIDKNSTASADLNSMKQHQKAEEQAEVDRWRLERRIMNLLDKMMKGE